VIAGHRLWRTDRAIAEEDITLKLSESIGSKPIQHFYDDQHNHCYGCGPNNDEGLQLKSYWQGDKAIAQFNPSEKHRGIPGFVYGGLVASLIDCHAMATAAADHIKLHPELTAMPRFVTGTMTVRYVNPTPLKSEPLVLNASVTERSGRKSRVQVSLSCGAKVTAEGDVIAFHIPEAME